MSHPREATLAALAAIALWGSLAWLSLKLVAWPRFFLLGCALAVGALPALTRIRDWRVPLRTLGLGVYGWPLLIVFLAPVLRDGHRLRANHVAGAVMGFTGAALLVAPDVEGGRFAIGYVYALVSALIWSSYSLWTKRVLPFRTAAIACSAWWNRSSRSLSMERGRRRLRPLPATCPHLLAMGVGPMGSAFFLWDYTLKRGDPRLIGTLAYLTPVRSTALLIITGRGVLSLRIGAAAALVIGGAKVAARVRRR